MISGMAAALWRHHRDIVIVVISTAVVLAFAAAARALTDPGFPLDDAWIHQTYARNLAQRGEWAFVPSEPSAASTAPLYTVMLALGYSLKINHFVWAFLLGILALAAAGGLSARMAAQMFPDLPSVGMWTGLAVVTTWQLVWAASSGMETMLFAALSLAFIGTVWRSPAINVDPGTAFGVVGNGMLTGILGALLTLTRPEGAVLVVLAALAVTMSQSSDGPRWQRWSSTMLWTAGLIGGWLMGMAPYLALNLHIEGTLLPNTSAAKQAEYASLRERFILARFGTLLLPLVVGGQILLAPGLVIGVRHAWGRLRADRRTIVFLLPAVWAGVLLSAYALRLPVAYQHGRYVMPALPHIELYGVGGTLLLLRRQSRRGRVRRVLSRTLAIAALAIVPGFLVIGAQQYGADVRIINTEMVATARWVRDQVPPEELLAVHDIGAVGYFAPRPILDLAGLVSPEVVPIIQDGEALMRLMCERDVRYLMVFPDQRPAAQVDARLGHGPVFVTGAPYAPAAGGANMLVYALQWPAVCD